MTSVLVYLYPDMADFEVTLLLHRLRNTGKRQIIGISETLSPIIAQSGLTYVPDRRIEDVAAEDPDIEALLIPGGPINNEQNAIGPLAAACLRLNKLVGAICFGPQFLGRAGLLNDRRYTTSCSAEKIRALGVTDPFPRHNKVSARVVQDGNLITAQGYAFVDFAQAICRALHIFANEQQEYEQLGRIVDGSSCAKGTSTP